MNKYLTKASLRVLQKLKEDEDGEVTWEKGAGYWIGFYKVSTAGCEHLLRLCLLRQDYSGSDDTYIIYTAPSAEVDRILTDDSYVPAIVRAQATGEPQFVEGNKK
jgi:hypothetical protein